MGKLVVEHNPPLAFSSQFSFTRREFSAGSNKSVAVYDGTLVAAGRTRNFLDEPGPWEFTATAIRDAIAAGMFDGLACFIDHASFFDGPSMRDLLGSWHNVVFNEETQAAEGELHIYISDDTQGMIDRLDAISADKKNGFTPPDVGVSLVCYLDYESVEGVFNRITRFYSIESADVVFQPAVPTARLQFQQGDLPMPKPVSTEVLPGNTADAVVVSDPLQTAAVGTTATTHNVHITNVMPPAPVQEEPVTFDAAPDPDAAAVIAQLQQQLAEAQRVTQQADQWRNAFSTQVAAGMIASSSLPQAAQTRLLGRTYNTAEEVQFAIDTEKAYVEEMADLYRAQFIATGPRPITSGDMTTEEDRVRNAVEWMFGVEGSTMPDSMEMRNLAWLWVAATGDDNFNGVFSRDRQKFTMLTALTLPNLALDAMNKIIYARIARLDHYRWFERFVKVEPNNGTLMDLKYISYGGIGNLPTVADTAAYTELGMTDGKETSSFVKKGGYVPLSRTIIKNSDLMKLQAIPTALATAAIRTRAKAVAEIFTANSGVGPTMSDTKALFHTDHGNLQTTAFGTDDAAWIAVQKEVYKQTEMGTTARMGMMPRFCLVPIDLYAPALKVFGYGTGELTTREILTQDRGPYDPRPEVIPVPEWTDTNDWAYLVDPALWPVLHMSYSQSPGGGSHPTPELFIANDPTSGLLFSNDVLPIKVRDEWTLGVSSYVGIGKRNVSGG